MADPGSDQELLDRVRRKRIQLESYLSTARPRKRRLLNTTIVAGTCAAALTAAPAIGGPSLTSALTVALGLDSPSWRVLCAAASVCSIMATVATQLLKSQNVEEHVTRAQGCRAKLEVLEVGLTMGQLDTRQATSEYLKCVEDAAFLDAGDA
jgi:MFS family permease